MASVTQRIKAVEQPSGGYLPVHSFSKTILHDNSVLHAEENIHPSLVGLAVDYLTRFMLGDSVDESFRISTLGANKIGMNDKALLLKTKITGLDDGSIISACKLSGFDVCFRSSLKGYKPVEEILPDTKTIENIRIMVQRGLKFWNEFGPVTHRGITFEGGYSKLINSGDGDYLTQTTLWDFKVLKSAPTTKHTLQILTYYIMGLHSNHDYLKNITSLGIFNPRLNIVYTCPTSVISKKMVESYENSLKTNG